MILIFGLLFGLFLAYANGANDNFKGVATLFGSATTSYRKALIWATLTTAAGSIMALFLARDLLSAFTGKGLVPDDVVALKSFALSVGAATAATVMLATWRGFPISTTHAIVGALLGAGFAASRFEVNFGILASTFFIPLLLSPLLAMALAGLLYPLFRLARLRLGIEKETCLCVGSEALAGAAAIGASGEAAAGVQMQSFPKVSSGSSQDCIERYEGRLFGVQAQSILDPMHYLSAGMVGFARGLNDTPKIAAILLAGAAIAPGQATILVAVAMAVGGLLSSRKIAEVMAHRVTAMNAGQGFTANLVTGLLVIFASRMGVPVSTTHVSCGSLFGIGMVTGQGNRGTILGIIAGWIVTLPIAAALGGVSFLILNSMIA